MTPRKNEIEEDAFKTIEPGVDTDIMMVDLVESPKKEKKKVTI
jgi:hypothetical protein